MPRTCPNHLENLWSELRDSDLGNDGDFGNGNLGSGDFGSNNLGGGNLGNGNLGDGNLGNGNLGDGNLRGGDLGSSNLRSADLGNGDGNLRRGDLENYNGPLRLTHRLSHSRLHGQRQNHSTRSFRHWSVGFGS